MVAYPLIIKITTGKGNTQNIQHTTHSLSSALKTE